MIKDYLGRQIDVDDYVVFMQQHYRRLKLAKVYAVTSTGKVRITWGEHEWQKLLQTGDQLVKVEGEDLTFFLLTQK